MSFRFDGVIASMSTHEHQDHAEHEHEGMECCAHHEIEITEWHLFIYFIGVLLVACTTIAKSWHWISDQVVVIPAMVGAILLGAPLIRAAFKELTKHKASSSSLAALAITAAFVTGRYETAGYLAFILLIADQFLRRSAWGAQRAIAELLHLTPDIARIVDDQGNEKEIALADVRVGALVRVRPGENLPVDGHVVAGRTTINQASLTGESVPVDVQVGDEVYAGTSNLTGNLDIRVDYVGAETTIGKVTQLIREAEQSRSPKQLLIEQVARFFVPVALSVALIVLFVKSQNPATRDIAIETAVTVLVVTCPAALLLSFPTAMVAAFAAAARLGILIKQTDYLEASATIDTVILDKTGTLTTGKFGVSKLAPAEGIEGAELLTAAANGEQHSNHPLAQSIITTAKAARIEVDGSDDFEEFHGRGVRANTSMGEICAGRSSWLIELHPEIQEQVSSVESRIEGMSGVHVMRDGKYLGAVGLEDRIRPQTRGVMDRLRELGVRQIAMFTGDRLSVAKRVGVAVGVDSIEAECLPEEKHELIQTMNRQGNHTLMVGDGINDGPSLAEADVGIAMGLSGSDIATNSAGIALMTDDLARIPFLIELSRKARIIVAQNIAASILIALIGLTLAATGHLNVPAAALYHFLGDVFVIGNSFRLFRFGENFAESGLHDQPQTITRREASIRGLSSQAT